MSHTIENVLGEPEKVDFFEITHSEGAKILGASANLSNKDFPDGIAINTERVKLTTHTGTHLDAPYHFSPYTKKEKSLLISEIPLEWCWGKGKLIDLSDSKCEDAVSINEIMEYLDRTSLIINKNDIVLINTGADKYWNTEKYFTSFRGISKSATEFLLDFGVNIIGVDSFGFDPPFHKMITEYTKTQNKGCLWPAHVLGRTRRYCHIERLTNLKSLNFLEDYYISCLPIKMNTGASWIRAVAIEMRESE